MTVSQDNSVTNMKKVVFVCTGNTCRSPMAEAVFNNEAGSRNIDIRAYSCGIYADGISSISKNAQKALANSGISSNHVSCIINKEILKDADYIFGMTQNHAAAIKNLYPEYSDKIYSLPIDISDPFGADLDIYQNCLEQIKTAINIILDKSGDKKL